nr:UxaA family hydrolase [Cupriavidus basilensis]
MAMTFLGYRRENDTVGVRNWVAVISVMDNCNPVTRTIAQTVSGCIPVTTLFVRGQFGADLDFAYESLAGLGRNPNVAAVLLVGLEDSSTEEVARRIRTTGKPVETVHLQPNGTIDCVAAGTRKALKLSLAASRARREPCPVSALVLGVECGGSDTTSGLSCNPAIGRLADRVIEAGGTIIISETSEFIGAEHLFAERAVDDAVRDAFVKAVRGMENLAMSAASTCPNPSPRPTTSAAG